MNIDAELLRLKDEIVKLKDEASDRKDEIRDLTAWNAQLKATVQMKDQAISSLIDALKKVDQSNAVG